jgi:hypothetical protein
MGIDPALGPGTDSFADYEVASSTNMSDEEFSLTFKR